MEEAALLCLYSNPEHLPSFFQVAIWFPQKDNQRRNYDNDEEIRGISVSCEVGKLFESECFKTA